MAEIVYIITNPSMPGLVKIGLTTRENPIGRMKELFSTGVPEPFECAAAWLVPNASGCEAELHRKFAGQRVSPAREFFRVSVSEASDALAVIGVCDLTEEVYRLVEAENDVAFRRPVQNWLEMGYTVGERLFAGDTGEYVTIVDGRRVEYRNNIMSLSAARRLIREQFPRLPASGAFHVNGTFVEAVYDQTYGKKL